METLSFADWLSRELGTRQWCVAARLTDRLRGKGYELALSQKRYSELARRFEEESGKREDS